jgi:hypothetical protein
LPQEEQLLAGMLMMVRIDMDCLILRFIVITAVAGAALLAGAGAGAVLIFLLL